MIIKKLRGLWWRLTNPFVALWDQSIQGLRNRKNLPPWKKTYYRLLENGSSVIEGIFIFLMIVFAALTVGFAFAVGWVVTEIQNTWTEYD